MLDSVAADSTWVVRERVGGTIDFGNQEDREMIGREIVGRVRAQRETRTQFTGTRIC